MIIRNFYLDKIRELRNTPEIKVITGVRRCGKTELLKQIIEEIKNEGVSSENIIYISLESRRYNFIKSAKQLDGVVYDLIRNIEGKVYLFFDEIEVVSGWEEILNAFKVDLNCEIYITSSNSKLLSGELSTVLTGRYVKIDLYPLSYKELLGYYKDKTNGNLTYNDEEDLFWQYATFGGFPGLLRYPTESGKELYLNSLYDSILINDIANKNKVTDVFLLGKLLEFIVCNIGKRFSARSIVKYLKQEGVHTSVSTLTKYLDHATKAFILYKSKREDLDGKKLLKLYEKFYVVDPGFYYKFTNETNEGQLIENIVYLELLKRGYEISVGELDKLEVDFVCRKSRKVQYIQVSETIIDPKTRKREFKSLEKIKDNYPKIIVTLDTRNYSKDGIIHKNLIEFLKELD